MSLDVDIATQVGQSLNKAADGLGLVAFVEVEGAEVPVSTPSRRM